MTWSRISRRRLPTQRSATPFCQRARTWVRLVPGDDGLRLTMTRRSAHRGQRRRRVVQKCRSQELNGGRGRLRFSTASCWRKASTSSAVSLRVLKKTLTAARRGKTNSTTIHLCSMGKFHAGRARRSKAEAVELHHRVLSTHICQRRLVRRMASMRRFVSLGANMSVQKEAAAWTKLYNSSLK